FNHQPENSNRLSHNTVRAINEDSSGTLWFGTGGDGLYQYNPKTQSFVHFKHQPSDPKSLSHDYISTLYIDSKDNLWIAIAGGRGGGLDQYHPKTQDFSHYQHVNTDPHSLSNDIVYAILEDSEGTLWIATAGGLNRFDAQTKRFESYQHQPSNPQSLSHNKVKSIHEDNQGTLWLATDGGLNKFDTHSNSFTHYRRKDGLSANQVHGILGDKQGSLWLSTRWGLSKFNPVTETFKTYYANDGLHSSQYFGLVYFKSADGELFFGGNNGFNRFYPENIEADTQAPNVILTDFLLANQSVAIAPGFKLFNNSTFTLPKAINALAHLTLSNEQNLITFEFAVLHFDDSMKNQYAYMLLGQDKDWIYTDAKNRRATYSNLPAGDYTLRIKASNSEGYWNEQGKSLKITVTPAPWNTWWAYTFYFFLIASFIWALFFVYNQQQRLRRQQRKTQNEQTLNLRLQQVDKLKDEFLANTSHELRTPLNGIIGLAESLMDGARGTLSKGANNDLAMVVSSGKRLSNLINDVLDFSKLKNRNLTLQTRPIDLYSVVEVVLTLSRPLLANKNLELINDVPKGLPAALADENRLQQILHNLVGNALKFTDSGKVTVSAEQHDDNLIIKV
ncbi:MAG: GGDEF domain-containing protein, partial [Algicola sp.]|nr:GGDEF domain-containing protein [Algicola sp.]